MDAQQLADQRVEILTRMGAAIDKTLLTLSSEAPEGEKEFSQARQLVSAGLAKHVASTGKPGATSPNAIGNQFPGGGFSSFR